MTETDMPSKRCRSECPVWAEKGIYRTSNARPRIESVGVLRPYCDASRPDWQRIWEAWNKKTCLAIFLCADHAADYGFES
jgi:hypothetical protein